MLVRVEDSSGRGISGKDVYLWVKPDKGNEANEIALFDPGNERVGVRSKLQEIGDGSYVYTEDTSSSNGFLWVQNEIFFSDGSLCNNCSNAPFEYTLTVDGVRSSTALQVDDDDDGDYGGGE
eukprot:380370-Hanusia_phi.AAC.1